jgi:TetR/AcrR family transcriptional regulator of autoinduction and epiphytic fitness
MLWAIVMVREIKSSKPQGTQPRQAQPRPLERARQPVLRPRQTEISDAAKLLHLIESAEAIFLAKGFHTATMNDVAKAAGMSKKTVYKLIDSKAGLFEALIEHHAEKLVMPAIKDDWTMNEILVQFLLRLGEFLLSPAQISLIRLIMAEYTHSTDFGRIFHQKRVNKSKTQLETWLAQACAPAFWQVADVREMAAMLFGMALGEFHVSVLIGFRPVPTKAALARRVRCAVDVFLNGCEAIIRA